MARMAGLLLSVFVAVMPCGGSAQQFYTIDQHFGTISFSVRHLRMFSSSGTFQHWNGTLLIDSAKPEQTEIDMTIDAGSVNMAWQDSAALLRSASYFDVARYPQIHFKSSVVRRVAQDRYEIDGQLEIRGIRQPQAFDAVLIDRHEEPAIHAEVADFVVTGRLRRSAFGMTSDMVFISDAVDIDIRVHIELPKSPRAG